MSGRPYWLPGDRAGQTIKPADRDASPLQGYRGAAERHAPTVELGPVGPWDAHVKVVPVTGLSGAGTHFDVVARWLGPPAPGGLQVVMRPVDAETSYLCDDGELAAAIAVAVADLLRERQVPFIDDVADAFREASTDWRRRYDHVVGDAGRAAAEGF